ncbi:MAG: glutathione S-transferase, partial [Parvularculaceae bacterium]|nr:glutathione S-transferase [Parvularculaceae bacterium]
MTTMTLYGEPGWGSAIVEAQLAWLGLAHDYVKTGDLLGSEEARARLVAVNPIAQVPTLVLADGRVLTESAAITLHLADLTGCDDLVPAPNDATRPAFLRWLVYLVANIYPTFTYGDVPSRFVTVEAAQQPFRAALDAYEERLWGHVEAAAVGPWFLGDRFSAL